jgi:hypothetical protein
MNNAEIGIKIAAFLFVKKAPLNNATAIIGEKFGGKDKNNLEPMDKIINAIAMKNLMSILFFIVLWKLVCE